MVRVAEICIYIVLVNQHPNLKVASIVHKFHANLWDRIGSIVFVRKVLVSFDNVIINTYFELYDEDSEEYRALY